MMMMVMMMVLILKAAYTLRQLSLVSLRPMSDMHATKLSNFVE